VATCPREAATCSAEAPASLNKSTGVSGSSSRCATIATSFDAAASHSVGSLSSYAMASNQPPCRLMLMMLSCGRLLDEEGVRVGWQQLINKYLSKLRRPGPGAKFPPKISSLYEAKENYSFLGRLEPFFKF
jgi:hypothetical protein